MKKAKFWMFQIAMVAIVSLVLGSPALAGPDKAAKAAKVTTADDDMTHGEEMRLEKANLESGKAEWKVVEEPDTDPTCADLGLIGEYPNCF